MDQLEQYERLGRAVMEGLEIPNLPPYRLQIWFRLIGLSVMARIKMVKETEDAGV